MKRGSIRRMYRLDAMIRLGRMRSAEQAAQELEVSRRTIERDLEMLRFELDADVLVNNGGDWYVIGLCRQTKLVRTFALGRIHEPEILDQYVDFPENFNVQEYLSQGFGRMRENRGAGGVKGIGGEKCGRDD